MKKKMISLLLVLALVVGICPAAFAEEVFNDLTATDRQDAEAEANAAYTKILSCWGLEQGEVTYPDFYAGAYINEDGNLVVRTVNATPVECQYLKEISENPALIIDTSAEYSYQQLADAKEEIACRYVTQRGNSNRLYALRVLDDKNTLQIELESTTPNAVNDFYNTYCTLSCNSSRAVSSIPFDMLEIVQAEKASASSFPSSREKPVATESQLDATAEAPILDPGSQIWVFSGGVYQGNLSIGFPCSRDGVAGFVTAQHGMGKGHIASTERSGGVSVGKCVAAQYSGKVDAAFASYMNDAQVASTFKFKTSFLSSETRTLAGTTAVAQNSTIYKVGATTGYKTGLVTSTNATLTIDGSPTLTDLIETNMDADHGDSGGCVFTKVGKSDAYVVGIIHARDSEADRRYIVKVNNIKSALGLTISFGD